MMKNLLIIFFLFVACSLQAQYATSKALKDSAKNIRTDIGKQFTSAGATANKYADGKAATAESNAVTAAKNYTDKVIEEKIKSATAEFFAAIDERIKSTAAGFITVGSLDSIMEGAGIRIDSVGPKKKKLSAQAVWNPLTKKFDPAF
ncbi:MAG: hypothetical protein QM791_04050 [Ferruginibacter sp.]